MFVGRPARGASGGLRNFQVVPKGVPRAFQGVSVGFRLLADF